MKESTGFPPIALPPAVIGGSTRPPVRDHPGIAEDVPPMPGRHDARAEVLDHIEALHRRVNLTEEGLPGRLGFGRIETLTYH